MVARILSIAAISLAACTTDVGNLGDAGALDASEPAADLDATVPDADLDAGIEPDSGCPAARSTVRGSVRWTYFANNGTSMRAEDLSGWRFSALVLRADGSFDRYPGSLGYAPGTFTINCVPEGSYYLEEKFDWGGDYLVTSSREIEERRYAVGRADGVPSMPYTNLLLDVGGLDPWELGDELELVTTFEENYLTHPAPGETSLDGVVVPVNFLMDATRGDRAALVQLTSKMIPSGETYTSIAKVFAPPPFTTTDGQSTVLTGVFTDPITVPLNLDWRIHEFAAMLPSPPPYPTFYVLTVASVPATATAQPSFYTELDVFVLSTATVTRSLAADFAIPVPFADDQLLLSLVAVVEVRPDSSWWVPTLLSMPLDRANPGSIVLRPQLSPPRNIRLNGMDTTQPLAGVGLTPTLTWDPPAFGTAARYVGTIQDLADFNYVFFETTETRFTVPPDLLAAGREYVFQLAAYAEGRAELSSASSIAIAETFIP